MNVIERFMQLLLEQEDESNLAPIIQNGDVAFMYIKHTNVYREFSLVYRTLNKNVLSFNKNLFKSLLSQKLTQTPL